MKLVNCYYKSGIIVGTDLYVVPRSMPMHGPSIALAVLVAPPLTPRPKRRVRDAVNTPTLAFEN